MKHFHLISQCQVMNKRIQEIKINIEHFDDLLHNTKNK